MKVLTAAEGAVLSQAREILYELSHGFTGESLQSRTEGQVENEGWMRDANQREIGQAIHAADRAEKAIFEFLNIATHYLDCPIARLNLEHQSDRGIADSVES